LGATQEAAIAQMRDIAERVPVAAAMVTGFRRVLSPDSHLSDAVEALLQTSQHEFPVVNSTGSLAGILTRDDLIAALKQVGPDAPVGRVMRTVVPRVSSRTPFEDAFEFMQESQSPVVVVTGDDGRLAGLVTPENVGERLLLHSALGGRQPSGGWLGPKIASPRWGT
jgi:stage IV sporulation protein FB